MLCGYDGWLWPQIYKKEKKRVHIVVQTSCHASSGQSHDKC
jgi:hypothetical protein